MAKNTKNEQIHQQIVQVMYTVTVARTVIVDQRVIHPPDVAHRIESIGKEQKSDL